jgi:predicted  nucleic acid-binding Zn-ribbon protein
MQMVAKLVLAFLSTAALAQGRSAVGSPVEKVAILLKELKTNLDQDQENEQKIYDKYACWCDTSLKLKANAIDQARIDLRALSQEILKLKGEIATLEMEIQELTAQIAKNLKLQADATAMRQKENAAFMAESTEMKEALAALQEAILVLIAGTKADVEALLQEGTHRRNDGEEGARKAAGRSELV